MLGCAWLAVLPAISWVAGSAPAVLLAPAVARSPPPRAALKPYRSDNDWDYFRLPREFAVTLTKPLGALLEESEGAGVRVEGLQEGGSAAESGALKKGDRLIAVMGQDVSSASFDEVMELLIDAPAEVELGVKRIVVTRKARAVLPPSILKVDGTPLEVKSGAVMRTSIQENGLEIHKGMKAKMSSCGGAGQCSSCWVEVTDGLENLSDKTASERKYQKKWNKPDNWRMACQALVNGPATVVVKSLDKE